MRVAMVILEYPPLVGGAQRQLASVAPLLQRRGTEVHVLTRRVGDLERHEVLGGVPVHRLAAPGSKVSASLSFTASALARLASLRPTVVHAYSLFSPTTIAVLAGRALGVGTVVKVLRGGRGGDVERLRRKPFSTSRIARIRHQIDRFVTISSEIDDELGALAVPAARRRHIPNGVDTQHYRPVSAGMRSQRRLELGWPDAPTAIYCGRLVSEKRIDLLLQAWQQVRQRHPEAYLVVVGDGPEAATLRRAAGSGVRFPGETDDVVPLLQASDLFVLPSATEGLSNAMLEAMAVGLPVVATRVGGATDVVLDRISGRLVAAGDAAELADAVDATLSDPARRGLGARGRERVIERYSLSSVADRLVELYEEVAASRRPPRTVFQRRLPREMRA